MCTCSEPEVVHSLAVFTVCCYATHVATDPICHAAAVEEAVAQTDVAEGELHSAASGDSQQRGSTTEAATNPDDSVDSVLAKPGCKGRSEAKRRLPAGQLGLMATLLGCLPSCSLS